MRVVLPNSHLRLLPLGIQMSDQGIERFGHVTIAQVPGLNPSAKHCSVVPFRVEHEARILFGKEKLILCDTSVTTGIIRSAASQLNQLINDFAFTCFGDAEG